MNEIARPEPWAGAPRPPRKWQAEALPICMDALRRKVRGIVVACTGSGKSVLQAEVCHELLLGMQAKGRDGFHVLVTVPSQDLVEQLAKTIRARCGRTEVGRWYGKRKELRRIVVTCLPSLPTVAEALRERGARVAVWLADEVHKTFPDEVQDQVAAIDPIARLGFTATPYRSDHREHLRGFDTVLVRYLIGDAVHDGALVPPRVVRWRGDEIEADDACVQMIREHGHGPGIASASSIADAEAFAERLTASGVPAAAVHSELGDADRTRRLRQLRDGSLRALVHVALLVEGVDFPWLRWLCMRRNTGAAVRVVQELGRVLRVLDPEEHAEDIARWGPKVDAAVLDPWHVLGRVGIQTDARFGDEVLLERVERVLEREIGDTAEDREAKRVAKAVAVTEVEGWLADVLLAAQLAGVVQPDTEHRSGGWRGSKASPRQRAAIERFTSDGRKSPLRYVPDPARSHLKRLVEAREHMSAGAASDLLSLMFAVRAATAEHAKATRAAEAARGAELPARDRFWRWPRTAELPDIGADTIQVYVEGGGEVVGA